MFTLPFTFYERIRSDGIPPGFESQSTIICEDQLSALMMSDFDDEIIDKVSDDSDVVKIRHGQPDTSCGWVLFIHEVFGRKCNGLADKH